MPQGQHDQICGNSGGGGSIRRCLPYRCSSCCILPLICYKFHSRRLFSRQAHGTPVSHAYPCFSEINLTNGNSEILFDATILEISGRKSVVTAFWIGIDEILDCSTHSARLDAIWSRIFLSHKVGFDFSLYAKRRHRSWQASLQGMKKTQGRKVFSLWGQFSTLDLTACTVQLPGNQESVTLVARTKELQVRMLANKQYSRHFCGPRHGRWKRKTEALWRWLVAGNRSCRDQALSGPSSYRRQGRCAPHCFLWLCIFQKPKTSRLTYVTQAWARRLSGLLWLAAWQSSRWSGRRLVTRMCICGPRKLIELLGPVPHGCGGRSPGSYACTRLHDVCKRFEPLFWGVQNIKSSSMHRMWASIPGFELNIIPRTHCQLYSLLS